MKNSEKGLALKRNGAASSCGPGGGRGREDRCKSFLSKTAESLRRLYLIFPLLLIREEKWKKRKYMQESKS
jgi:hypothetical protein